MYAGRPPFFRASLSDDLYRQIHKKNYPAFWKAHSKKKPKIFSDDFKDLFQRMVAYEPAERITIS